ncbi:hypothetical protein ONS95_008475 [Cadophora gregata]|uniref:uncharacterized protein n=1 Tax=Cadophora gregata TaxID=51156 RepID=UPI0026DD9C68|nr:uncharacterized protein ONS95_008475 [Cadophora gregata]KAK0100136.1 hypothetical protein ONS95_008475 [Cadophora gregata]
MEDSGGEKMLPVALKGTISVWFVATLHSAHHISEQTGSIDPPRKSLGDSGSSSGLEVTPSPPHSPIKPLAGVDGTVTETRTEGRVGRAIEPQAAAEIQFSEEEERIADEHCAALLCGNLLDLFDSQVAPLEAILAKDSDELQELEKRTQVLDAQLTRLMQLGETEREQLGVQIDIKSLDNLAELKSEVKLAADRLVSTRAMISTLKFSFVRDAAAAAIQGYNARKIEDVMESIAKTEANIQDRAADLSQRKKQREKTIIEISELKLLRRSKEEGAFDGNEVLALGQLVAAMGIVVVVEEEDPNGGEPF